MSAWLPNDACKMPFENGFYVEIHNFRYVEITTKQLSLCQDHEKIKS